MERKPAITPATTDEDTSATTPPLDDRLPTATDTTQPPEGGRGTGTERQPAEGMTAALVAALIDMPPTRSSPDEIVARRMARLQRLDRPAADSTVRTRPRSSAAPPVPAPQHHDWEDDPRPFALCLREWGRRRHGLQQARARGAADLRLSPATYAGYCHGLLPASEGALRRLMTLLDRFVPPAG